MADDEKDDDPEPKGELMRREPPLPLAARTGQQRTIDWLLSRLSRWPFRNRGYAESLKTAREVIEEQTRLEETIVGHGKTRGKLNDLETILAQDRLQRKRELLEEQRRLSAVLNETMLEGEMQDDKNELKMEEVKRQQKEQRIQRMEQEKRELLLVKELEELRKPPPAPEPPPKKKMTRGRTEKQKLREDVITRYEKEIARIDAMKKSDKAKATLKKAAEAEKEKEMAEIENMP
jgi:hypothetical protein